MENDKTLKIVIGALLGVGCGGLLLLSCVASGMWFATRSVPVASGRPPYTPPPPVSTPPYVPPPYVPPPYVPPPALPPMLPPPTLPPPTLPPGPGGTGDLSPRLVRATVTEASGAAGVAVGALCEFNVERRENGEPGGFWCNAQVVCGGRLLYGGAEAGYFPCTLYEGPPRDVVGEDTGTTSTDRDGAMRLDTRARTLEVWDDATGASGEFRVTAHVDSVE